MEIKKADESRTRAYQDEPIQYLVGSGNLEDWAVYMACVSWKNGDAQESGIALISTGHWRLLTGIPL